jgi:hypothetical protein
MLTRVLQELDQELQMRHGTVMLLSPDGNELIVEAARSNAKVWAYVKPPWETAEELATAPAADPSCEGVERE